MEASMTLTFKAALCAFACTAAIVFTLFACGSSDNGSGFSPNGGTHGDGGTGPGTGDGSIGSFGDDSSFQGDDGGTAGDVFVLPANFVPTEHGGYALGAPLTGDGADAGLIQNGNSSNCSLVVGVVRDFKSFNLQTNGHPDFEHFSGNGPTLGLVQKTLGTDRKPIYGAECDNNGSPNPPCKYGQEMTTQANFDQWYRFTQDVNMPYLVYLQFVPNGGVYTFESHSYFPLDNAGFGNTPGWPHNFSFTTEIHVKFSYKGGETFSFSGDDDLWVFINGKLAMDLGGLHPPANGSVNLDSLGLTKGQEYDLELFNAERHTDASNFRADTNLAFTNCGTVPPDVPK
jgi:fibro-slime domain-containing protein